MTDVKQLYFSDWWHAWREGLPMLGCRDAATLISLLQNCAQVSSVKFGDPVIAENTVAIIPLSF